MCNSASAVQYMEQQMHLIKYNTIHVMRNTIAGITLLCFCTGVPPAGSLRTNRFTKSNILMHENAR